MKKLIIWLLLMLIGFCIGAGSFYLWWSSHEQGFANPLAFLSPENIEYPLNKYKINELSKLTLPKANMKIISLIADSDEFKSYLVSFETLGGSMSAQLNLPKTGLATKLILMIRGYVPLEIYQTGVGTRAAASVFANHGYATLAPDFLGFGVSSNDFDDSWESRFVKPAQMMGLFNELKQLDLRQLECLYEQVESKKSICEKSHEIENIGIWAHSNGGQIALTTLEAIDQGIPTSLWAPVTVPFPYSVLFFTDEMQDEGKATRIWLNQFEKSYDVFDFSLTKHLSRLQGPIQIQHGTMDEAALYSWSLEFAQKIEDENALRQKQMLENQTASMSAQKDVLPKIEFELITHHGADHNLKPTWDNAINQDLVFFSKHL